MMRALLGSLERSAATLDETRRLIAQTGRVIDSTHEVIARSRDRIDEVRRTRAVARSSEVAAV